MWVYFNKFADAIFDSLKLQNAFKVHRYVGHVCCSVYRIWLSLADKPPLLIYPIPTPFLYSQNILTLYFVHQSLTVLLLAPVVWQDLSRGSQLIISVVERVELREDRTSPLELEYGVQYTKDVGSTASQVTECMVSSNSDYKYA